MQRMCGVKGIEYYTSMIIIICQTNKLIDKYGGKKQPQLKPLHCRRKREKE
jgi:hypothetical protein